MAEAIAISSAPCFICGARVEFSTAPDYELVLDGAGAFNRVYCAKDLPLAEEHPEAQG